MTTGADGPAAGRPALGRPILIGAALLAVAAAALWARFGTAVFLETMASAWAYCF